MSMTKKFLKSKPICKVTFRLTKDQAKNAGKVTLVGDFNDWDEQADEMEALKNGSFRITKDLDKGKEYQFRYLLDGAEWENDWQADKYVHSEFAACDNSVVIV